MLAREDDEGEEEDELQLQPEWAASLAGFPSPDDAPEDFMAGGEASDEWETDDEGEGEEMQAEVGDQVCAVGCAILGSKGLALRRATVATPGPCEV